jgi:hypothetical protein
MMRATLLEELNFYSANGYQIVFDFSGIRVWYLPAPNNLKLYEGEFMNDALAAMEKHYKTLEA